MNYSNFCKTLVFISNQQPIDSEFFKLNNIIKSIFWEFSLFKIINRFLEVLDTSESILLTPFKVKLYQH